MLSVMMLILIVLAGLLLLTILGFGTFWFLVQIGVIAQKAMEPPARDSGGYSLDQGREVGEQDKRS